MKSSSLSADSSRNPGEEKRKYPRILLRLPVSCVSIGKDNLPLDQNKGLLKDINQGGAAIEAETNAVSDRIALVLTDLSNEVVGILGKVAYSKKTARGTYHLGVSFDADHKENVGFVSKAVRLYHYTRKQSV
jgi:hypothetical protein